MGRFAALRRALALRLCPEMRAEAGSGGTARHPAGRASVPATAAEFAPDAARIADRLREERKRLGLTQTEFGLIGGVKKLAQHRYEVGERHPNARYLAAVAAAGADVLYILTGARQAPVFPDIPRPAPLPGAPQTPGRKDD